MQLDGLIQTNCPPEKVALLLLDPQALRQVAPQGCEVGERSGDTVPFVIRRKIGPINLNMAGQLTLTRTRDADSGANSYDLLLQASHMVAGRVKITLVLVPTRDEANLTNLCWTGALESHGLASRLIAERGDKVRSMLINLFLRLHAQAIWA